MNGKIPGPFQSPGLLQSPGLFQSPFSFFGIIAVTLAIGFLAGSLFGNRIARLRYGTELESVRAEQRRVTGQYQQLGANYTRARELNNNIRTIIAGSTELLQLNDGTISGLRRQISSLREKIQELENLFHSFDTGGVAGGGTSDVLADTVN
jgi:hypothetical protein